MAHPIPVRMVYADRMMNTPTHEPVDMPSVADLRAAAHTLDLAICALQDCPEARDPQVRQRAARLTDAHVVLDRLVSEAPQ